jgi:hypothetical protein
VLLATCPSVGWFCSRRTFRAVSSATSIPADEPQPSGVAREVVPGNALVAVKAAHYQWSTDARVLGESSMEPAKSSLLGLAD